MKILVLNSGSSSLKYQIIDMETEEVLAKGYYERIGQENSFLTHTVNGEKHKFERHAKNHEQAIQFVLTRLTNPHYGVIKDLSELGGIGHRAVHGGEYFSEPVIITEEVIEKIEKCSSLAPLHNPAAVEEAMQKLKDEGAKRVIPLKTSGPFHTSKLQEAKNAYEKELEKIQFNKGKCKVIKNIDGTYYNENDNIKEILANHIISPVRFDKAIKLMQEENVEEYIEIGPGRTLTGFIKKDNKEANTININSLESLENYLN